MALDPTLVKLLDDFADSMIALRLPTLPFGSSNPKIGTSLDSALTGIATAGAYSPTTPGDWSPVPSTTGGALDQTGTRLTAVEGAASTAETNALNAQGQSYSPTTPTDWAGSPPTTIKAALDRCAALLKSLNGGTGP